jgi:hypothetical protein
MKLFIHHKFCQKNTILTLFIHANLCVPPPKKAGTDDAWSIGRFAAVASSKFRGCWRSCAGKTGQNSEMQYCTRALKIVFFLFVRNLIVLCTMRT